MHKTTLLVDNPIRLTDLSQLRQIAGAGPVLILTHENPDPDGLASGKAFAALLSAWDIASHLVYSGLVGRAENRTMHQLLTPEWDYKTVLPDLHEYTATAILDSQPGAGNNNLSAGLIPDIVIDHHLPVRSESLSVPYKDIRAGIGATVSMVYQYLEVAQVPISADLATAMFYGLRADTNGLSRGATTTDGVIYVKLLDILDHQRLLQVEQSGLSRDYFQAFHDGLTNAQIVGKTITTYLGDMHRPDFVAEMADLLVRFEEVQSALCLGQYQNMLYFSLRTGLVEKDAGLIVQQIIMPPGKAGGHGTIAGGQYPLHGDDVRQVVAKLQANFLHLMNEQGTTTALITG